MIRTWHYFSLQEIALEAAPGDLLADALQQQRIGNWYGAGEKYLDLFTVLGEHEDPATRARVAAKAACAFETSGQLRPAAAAYAESARLLELVHEMHSLRAELFNRAAVAYAHVGEYFSAAMNWRACASAYAEVQSPVVNCSENWGPLPNSALKSHLVGLCYEAAASAAEKARGEEVWSVGAYWEAGKAYGSGIPNIQTYNAYRNALRASIRFYGTLSIERLRNILPLSSAERAEGLNPIQVMEGALLWCNEHHQTVPGPSQRAALQTWRELSAAYHSFSTELIAIANPSEAGEYRFREHELRRRIYVSEKSRFKAIAYLIWKTTASYGESLSRWAISCIFVLLLFSTLFYLTGSIGPITHKFDYLYFSTITFSTLGYGDIHPSSTVGEVLSCLEVACGFIMFGVLLTLVGARLKDS